MSFSFEPSELIAYQRAFSLAIADNANDSTPRIIKPLEHGSFHKIYNDVYLRDFRPSSPPIPFDLPDPQSKNPANPQHSSHKRQASRANARNFYNSRRRSKQAEASKEKEHPTSDASHSESPDFQETTLTTGSIHDDGIEEVKTKKINAIAKLFSKGGSSSASDSDSESARSGSSFNEPPEEFKNAAETESLLDISEEERESYSDGTIENEEENHSRMDEESPDSAFTEISTDSLVDLSSDMMYDYTVPETLVLQSDSEIKKKKKRKQADAILSKTKQSVLPSLPEDNAEVSLGAESPERQKVASLIKKRPSFIFSKRHDICIQNEDGFKSNLSKIIQSRHKSSDVNPLNFFAFDAIEYPEGAQISLINIYIPPDTKPVLEDLRIPNNLSVFDCIGYILLTLSKIPGNTVVENDKLAMNPNNWRLELTDDDGELYDSNFGVLDRSRLMASYNYPKHLALSKVKNGQEASKNEKQTPLPLEFKQSLESYNRSISSKQEEESASDIGLRQPVTEGSSLEVKIGNIPSFSPTKLMSFFVAGDTRIGELLELVCKQYRLDPSRYELANDEGSISNSDVSHVLEPWGDNTERSQNLKTLSEFSTKVFRLKPVERKPIRSMLDVAPKSLYPDVGITPNSSGFMQNGITPPVVQLEHTARSPTDKDEEGIKSGESRVKSNEHTDLKAGQSVVNPRIKPVLNIGKLIQGNSQHLPTSLSTIYFKWKVYRKKAPILNRIEKSLIIDGDYIHLAPTEDTTWKNTLQESSFAGGQSGHHHHYLHHYNYSKYYNDTILKTSSFHISQIIKIKQYKESKNPTHFKIVTKKETEQGGKETVVRKKYDLEAETEAQCDEIVEKIRWALQLYNVSNA